MLFSTDYPEYEDAIGVVHESRPHPIFHGLQKTGEYLGSFVATLFVMAFTGMEIVFVLALAMLALQAMQSWQVVPDMTDSMMQAWQGSAE